MGLVALGMLAATLCTINYVIGSLRAGRIIHDKLVASVTSATFRYDSFRMSILLRSGVGY